jgi:hypothetical protein
MSNGSSIGRPRPLTSSAWYVQCPAIGAVLDTCTFTLGSAGVMSILTMSVGGFSAGGGAWAAGAWIGTFGSSGGGASAGACPMQRNCAPVLQPLVTPALFVVVPLAPLPSGSIVPG